MNATTQTADSADYELAGSLGFDAQFCSTMDDFVHNWPVIPELVRYPLTIGIVSENNRMHTFGCLSCILEKCSCKKSWFSVHTKMKSLEMKSFFNIL